MATKKQAASRRRFTRQAKAKGSTKIGRRAKSKVKSRDVVYDVVV